MLRQAASETGQGRAVLDYGRQTGALLDYGRQTGLGGKQEKESRNGIIIWVRASPSREHSTRTRFLFLQEKIKDIIIIARNLVGSAFALGEEEEEEEPFPLAEATPSSKHYAKSRYD
jgi:hypothetical protein